MNLGPNGCILYDGTCGICTHFIYKRAAFFERYGFSVAASQEHWVMALEQRPEDDLRSEIRMLLPSGVIVRGPDVYRLLMQRIWYLYPLYLLSKLPLFNTIFDSSYRLFAARRKRFSRMCGLKPRFE